MTQLVINEVPAVELTVIDPDSISLAISPAASIDLYFQVAQGPAGPQGIRGEKGDLGDGLTILGEVASESELPTNAGDGDAYLVAGELYIWTGLLWESIGPVQFTTAGVDLVGTAQEQTLTNKTLTAPILSAATISDGTAGGVLYLNPSKVLASSNTLTFDGVNFSTPAIGINTSTPLAKLDVNGTTLSRAKSYAYQSAPVVITGDARSLIASEMLSGIISFTTGGGGTFTTPTGTQLDAALLPNLPNNSAFDFTVINTASTTFTVGFGTGVTGLGAMTVAPATSGSFRLRKTGTAAYTVYRL